MFIARIALLVITLVDLGLGSEAGEGEGAGRVGFVDIALGDFEDVAYTVLVTIGCYTGSSDTWVVAANDTEESSTTGQASANPFHLTPYDPQTSTSLQYVYDQSSASKLEGSVSKKLGAQLYYGDLNTRTHAFGVIAREKIGVTFRATGQGDDATTFTFSDQLFAVMTDTDTRVMELGAVGILGLGFLANSEIYRRLSSMGFSVDAQTSTAPPPENSYPLVSRLHLAGQLPQPMFSLVLQRGTVDPDADFGHKPAGTTISSSPVQGAGKGTLTLGGMPAGVTDSDMTWVEVKLQDNDGKIFPKSWEIPIQGVFFDGTRLDGDSGIVTTALVDSGNSWIRGPQPTVSRIYDLISTSKSGEPNTFPCVQPHTLEFLIGGTRFPVDPRDFAVPYYVGRKDICTANLGSISRADTKGTESNVEGAEKRGFVTTGSSYTWSLGAPFLKSVIAAFYLGNITHPAEDPPRIGLKSTVPKDANERMMMVASGGQTSSLDMLGPQDVEVQGGEVSKSDIQNALRRPRPGLGVPPWNSKMFHNEPQQEIAYEPLEVGSKCGDSRMETQCEAGVGRNTQIHWREGYTQPEYEVKIH